MTSPASSNVDSLLNQIKRNLGLPISAPRSGNEFGSIIDAAPFVSSFAKGERIYRMADWTTSTDVRSGISGSSQTRIRGSTSGLTGLEAGDDWTLSLTESSKPAASGRKVLGPRAARGVLPPRSSSTASRSLNRPATAKGNHATGAKSLGWGQRAYDRQKTRESSVKLDSNWTLLEEIEFSRISKLQFDPEAPELLASGGAVNFYNKAFDRLTTKSSKAVSIEEANQFTYLPLSSDPIIAKLANEIEGAVAFMSDAAAALLMATPRTVNPWDLVTKRISSKAVIIDQRDDAQSTGFSIDNILVNETANDPPTDDREAFNSAQNLAIEANRINNIVPGIICLSESQYVVGEDCSAPSGFAYKYYKWTMGEGKFLVIRSTVNAATRVGSNDDIVLIRSLLEFDSSRTGVNLDWRSKLDNQRGAILANEIRNNNSIIARWVFQAYLAQVDNIKLAYVSRISPKDRVRHELLALQDIEPYELATQMNLDTANGFGILKALFDLLTESQESVIIVRDPVKPILRLYNL